MDLRSTVLSSLFVFLVTVTLLYNRVTKKIPIQPRRDETRRKGPVFRVTGLPASQPDHVLNTTLKATIDENLSKEEKLKPKPVVAIVPSCYDTEQQRVALVEFPGGVPTFLSKLVANPLEKHQEVMDVTDISFDCHFFGFTQLYAPKPDAPVTADIIAITGLDGHAYGSWRGKGNLGRMWLRDFLSKDIPCCRTMVYGYNSKLLNHGIDTIMDYGRGLIEELKKIRNTEELRQRPLFFVAHSFGGIILAHCLVKAVHAAEDDHPTVASLYKATYGMLLFGIPHKGLVVDDIQKMLAGESSHPRDVLLQEIKSKSNLLACQLGDFKNLIRDRKIVSFYETGQTRQLEFDSKSKRWKRTGDFVTAVDADSALLQLPEHMEEKIPRDTDHSMIVKFDDRNDLGYTSARDKLRQFEQDAPSVVTARFEQAQKRPLESFLHQTPNGSILITSRNSTAAFNLAGTYGSIARVEPTDEEDASRRLLRELERYSEYHQLGEPFHGRLKVSPSKQPKTPLVNQTWIVPFERDARFIGREPVGGLEQTLGQDSEYTLDSKHRLGVALYRQNKQSEAEEVLRQAVRGREQTLGQDHEYTLNSKHWLGLALYQQKKYSEAEEVLRQVVRGRERTLGQDRKETLYSKHKLGEALYRRKKYSEAEEMLRQAVRGREQTLGQDRKETLNSKHRLGVSLYQQKKYSEAEEVLRQVMRGRERTLCRDHEDTLSSKYWLGRTLFDQQKYSGAEELFQQLADQQERILGRDHQHTLATVRLLQELRINLPPLLPVSNTS